MENSTICMWGRTKGGEQWRRVSNVSIFSPTILYIHDREYIRRIQEYKGRRIYSKTVPHSLDSLSIIRQVNLLMAKNVAVRCCVSSGKKIIPYSQISHATSCITDTRDTMSRFFFFFFLPSKIEYVFLHACIFAKNSLLLISERKVF